MKKYLRYSFLGLFVFILGCSQLKESPKPFSHDIVDGPTPWSFEPVGRQEGEVLGRWLDLDPGACAPA